MAQEAARIWSQAARRAVNRRGVFRAALCGGKTPKTLFRLLAQESFASLPWNKTEIYWADERHVPPGHAASNYRLARRTLLDRVSIPAKNIHPVPTESGSPKLDADSYEAALRRAFPRMKWPRFDLVLLGLGEDGHTASLFPGDAAVLENERWVRAARAPAGIRDRVTLTIPALCHARLALFLVCGRGKASILKKVLAGSQETLPARLIRPEQGRVIFLSDQEASA